MFTFIELNGFSKRRQGFLQDEEYRLLQEALIVNPELGPVMQGTGGFRKLRWSRPGVGKSGGVRVIYYSLVPSQDRLYLALIYAKNEADNLTAKQ
ncbi:type II toxin-antitoxin system RelE/ParE family toxin [Amphritea sp. HPY]|uniref:type II toxin-antitoxin system RelE/ParE family toxin n=1 Tax=Amphritea sp. HPY TaxID=3421652 RepID=UPI003D7E6062